MKAWMDAEFNGFDGELISLGIIAENDTTFYEVLDCAKPVPWVAQNILPVLGKSPVNKSVFQETLAAYLAAFDSLHIVCDWAEDAAHFCRSLIYGQGYAMSVSKLTIEIVPRDFMAQSAIPHNALEDAIALRRSQSVAP